MKSTFFVGTTLFLVLILGLTACGGGTSRAAAPSAAHAGDPVAGEKIFASACSTCHGPKGEGIQGLSQDMTQSELIASITDQELAEFIKTGGVPGEPLVMPPKGGVPSLTDENLYNIVAYIRSLQK